jgi:hypothetical protein
MIDQGHLRNVEIKMQRDDTINTHRGVGERALSTDTIKSWETLEKKV